ncbi:superoxide dismutase [Desulfosoma caldarium]|uniref:superoxide dismutase n=1 Tax=Desulfosoma caldarium TaxID=610254 RepID=A0A3N1UE83_9BACT|nr:superoxide dismutase [Desulfosoma caldarium]ROQ89544.1 superoxide dismutase [Desulfosoma caldarium]
MKKAIVAGVACLALAVGVVTCKRSEDAGKLAMSRALEPYRAMDFSHLLGMEGFSEALLKMHFTLYQGYVTNTNALLDKIRALAKEGKADGPEYAELKRRLGFEFNGMKLHEYYFGNLGGSGVLPQDNALYAALEENFGSFENWKADFVATARMRGIGWVVLYQDPATGRLVNTWINEHETGHFVGCLPLLVMDVFEHAYVTDYGLDRKAYIEAFFKNLNWKVVLQRFGVAVKEGDFPEPKPAAPSAPSQGEKVVSTPAKKAHEPGQAANGHPS